MTPEAFIANFAHIANAPGGVARLRELVLSLAVQGKLVPQDSNDEPASSLLTTIHEEKNRLVSEKKIRLQEEASPIASHELSFNVPEGWEWARLSTITCRIQYGFTASAKPNITDVRLLRITDIQNNSVDWSSVPGCEIAKDDVPHYQLKRGDVLVARTGGTIGKTYLIREVPVVAVFASYLIRIQGASALLDRYLKLFLESPVYWVQLNEGARGGAQPNVNGQTLGRMVVPVPPLAEQKRIVARADELMALCDQLEAQQQERERRFPVLSRTCHARFAEAPTPANLNRIFDETGAVSPNDLRRTILNIAVRGRLLSQNPDDQPASELLHEIDEALSVENANRKGLQLPPINESDMEYEVPVGWIWARFRDVAIIASNLVAPSGFLDLPHLAPDNIEKGSGVLLPCATVRDDKVTSSNHRFFAGQIVYSKIRPNLSKVVVVDFDGLCSADMYPIDALIDARFLQRYMLSDSFLAQAVKTDTRIAMPKINQKELNAVAVPVPPLAEQRRIVAKVDELMALVDQLEAQQQERDKVAEAFAKACVASFTTV